MAFDEARVRDLARSYTEAWCSRDPVRVASHYVPGGTIAINGGDAVEITEVAQGFIEAFPDIQVFMDDIAFGDEVVEYQWTFTGTSSPTGKVVRISGFEQWRLDDDGLVAESKGTYDQAEDDRQLEQGAPVAQRERLRSTVDEEVVPALYVEDAGRAVAWYERLGFRKAWGHQFEPGFKGRRASEHADPPLRQRHRLGVGRVRDPGRRRGSRRARVRPGRS